MSDGADGNLVTKAAAELYAGSPEEFTGRRKELAEAARAAGDREAARQITALRKPTRAAWVVNLLVRAEPGAPARLADLADGMRAAEQAKDGSRLRELTASRRALIDGLADQALRLAALPDPSAGLREDVTATLSAALADPDVAASLATGTLTRAAAWSGFGLASQVLPGGDGGQGEWGGQGGESAELALVPPALVAPVPLPPQAPRPLSPRPARRADPETSIPQAERAVATAVATSAAAAAEEESLEAQVRDLEQELTRTRADLADARLKARRAESAERNARQALARLTSTLG